MEPLLVTDDVAYLSQWLEMQRLQERYPRLVSAYEHGGTTHFSVLAWPGRRAELTPPTFGAPFSKLDDFIIRTLKRQSVRAAQVAVAFDGRLVHAAAYTWADVDYPVTLNTTRFRGASVGKTITSMAVLKLAEQKGIDIFDKVTANMQGMIWPGEVLQDQGWLNTTVAGFLCHVTGLRSGLALQGVFAPELMARALGKSVSELNGAGFRREDVAAYTLGLGAHLSALGVSPTLEMIGEELFTITPTEQQIPNLADPPAGRYSNFGYDRLGDMVGVQ